MAVNRDNLKNKNADRIGKLGIGIKLKRMNDIAANLLSMHHIKLIRNAFKIDKITKGTLMQPRMHYKVCKS
jgi:hypothetical protein